MSRGAGQGGKLWRACCAVVSRLLVNQYSVSPDGTLSEKYPAQHGNNNEWEHLFMRRT